MLDAIIIVFDEDFSIKLEKTYGGRLNDTFLDICFLEDGYVLFGKKDNLTEFPEVIFGVRLDKNLNITKVVTLNDGSPFLMVKYLNDYVILVTNKAIYKFSITLELEKANDINTNPLFFQNSFLNKLLIITPDTIYIYDFLTLRLKDVVTLDYVITDLIEFSNILYVNKNTYFDLADLTNLKYLEKIYQEVEPCYDVFTLFGKANYLEDVSSESFNLQVFGRYERKLKYQNQFGIEFFINITSEVPLEVNVSDGGIYPVGYYLKFTGNGYLNDVKILSNYMLSSKGNYTLRLVGKDLEEYIINFKVSDLQRNFYEDVVLEADLVVKKNEPYYLTFKYSNYLENIHSLVVDGKEYYDIIIDKEKNLLSVKMDGKGKSGTYYHVLEEIIFFEGDFL